MTEAELQGNHDGIITMIMLRKRQALPSSG